MVFVRSKRWLANCLELLLMKSPNFLESETLLKVTSRNESSDCMKIYSDKN